MNADLLELIRKKRRTARRKAVKALNRGPPPPTEASNGFKQLVRIVSRTAPGRAALNARNNLSTAERTYVNAILEPYRALNEALNQTRRRR